tara:strand:+ start:349 stop:1056 length:708 start_codon:yes stop_codon:yes gene_type:complete
MKLISWDVGIHHLAYCILEKKEDQQFQIVQWDDINIHSPNAKHQPPLICTQLLKNGTSCKAKAKSRTEDGQLYCSRHSSKAKTNRIPIKFPKKKKKSILELGINLIHQLNELNESYHITDVDLCVIENQPVLKNPKMKSIQMILYSYFLIHGLTCDESPMSHIRLCSPKNKLKVYQGPPIIIQHKSKYIRTKKLAIEHCKYFILDQKEHLDFFLNHKKQDDLADCFLQGLWILSK